MKIFKVKQQPKSKRWPVFQVGMRWLSGDSFETDTTVRVYGDKQVPSELYGDIIPVPHHWEEKKKVKEERRRLWDERGYRNYVYLTRNTNKTLMTPSLRKNGYFSEDFMYLHQAIAGCNTIGRAKLDDVWYEFSYKYPNCLFSNENESFNLLADDLLTNGLEFKRRKQCSQFTKTLAMLMRHIHRRVSMFLTQALTFLRLQPSQKQ